MSYIKIINCIILYTLLSSSTCNKQENDCHYDISINNISNTPVIYAKKYMLGNNTSKCLLSGYVLKANEKYVEHSPRDCWEDMLLNGKTLEIYIVDTARYNSPNVFYSCDSIEIKNTVLKHYVLTLDDLKRNNFTVTYP